MKLQFSTFLLCKILSSPALHSRIATMLSSKNIFAKETAAAGSDSNPAAMTMKMKGLLKGLRYISQIFDEEEEQELQIGNPTDVKHVAHIGWDGPTANAPSWINQFKGEGDAAGAAATAAAAGGGVPNDPKAQEKRAPSGPDPTTETSSKRKSDKPKGSRRKGSVDSSSIESPRKSSTSESKPKQPLPPGSESPARDSVASDKKEKSSRRKKSKASSGSSSKTSSKSKHTSQASDPGLPYSSDTGKAPKAGGGKSKET